ncbi:hypothetical protein GCM10022251_70990 [Phytohabitans flavus]
MSYRDVRGGPDRCSRSLTLRASHPNPPLARAAPRASGVERTGGRDRAAIIAAHRARQVDRGIELPS